MNKRLLGIAMTIGTAILSMVLPLDEAWAERRVALVVGNSNYASVPKLPNPSRDANSVAQMFRDAGFDSVDVVLNVGNLEFKRAIRNSRSTRIGPILPSTITPVTAWKSAAPII